MSSLSKNGFSTQSNTNILSILTYNMKHITMFRKKKKRFKCITNPCSNIKGIKLGKLLL